MSLKDCVVRTVAAGLVLFVLGSVIYTFLIEPSGVAATPRMWAIVVGSLLGGGLLSIVLGWNGASGVGEGAKAGGVFGLLMELTYGTLAHGTMAAGPALGDVVRDGIVAMVMYGIAGAVVGVLAARGGEA